MPLYFTRASAALVQLVLYLGQYQGYCVSGTSEDQFLDTVGSSVSKIANYLEIIS